MTAVYPTSVTVEMYLTAPLVDETGKILVDEAGRILVAEAWVDVSADVIVPSETWTRGNSGRTIFDRVSNIGSYVFVLNNSESNSQLTAGLYSPDHNSVAHRFGLDTKVRLTIVENGVTHEEWQGTISRIAPTFGIYGDRTTAITCEDWMAHAYRDKIRGVTVQSNKRDDQILTTLLTLAAQQPLATSFSTGDDTYTYALHDENSLSSTLARIFQKLTMSGFGRIYLTGYETLVYKSRSDLLLSGTPAATFADNMQGLKVLRDKNQRVKDILVTTFPAQIDASAAVLWASQRERELTAGESVEFDISFRDPSGRATRVAALSIVTPVVNTDYKFSSVSGSGTDLNASLGITVVLKADIATVTLTNNAGVTGYLWFHQQRGIGVYLYEPVTSYSETGQRDGETLNIEMVYQDDPNVGDDIKTLVTSWFVVDQTDIQGLTFIANYSQDFMTAAFLPPGSLVAVQETQTGIDSNYIINGTSKTFLSPGVLQVTWFLVPANQIAGVCLLDVVGLAELDSTAILGA